MIDVDKTESPAEEIMNESVNSGDGYACDLKEPRLKVKSNDDQNGRSSLHLSSPHLPLHFQNRVEFFE